MNTSRNSERGSALLIVFVFAAIIAIALYKEMPIAAFEARRNKEELLIERGNEYKRAVKLFVRKVGTFPGSIEALENTNRMRFLRHKFDDPMTGKSDWRMIHAGPNGIITDSKIAGNNGVAGGGMPGGMAGSMVGGMAGATANNPAANTNGTAAGGNPSAFGSSTSSFGNSGGSGFGSGTSSFGSTSGPQTPASTLGSTGNSGFGSFGSNSSAGAAGPTIAAVPQRAAAVSASAPPGGPADGAAPPAETGVLGDPNAPMTPDSPVRGGDAAQMGYGAPGNAPANPAGGTDQQTQLRNLLNNQNPSSGNATTAASGSSFGTGSTGKLVSGGIAGVASIAKGKTIKLVNDQKDFSLWEFYYDMAKDAAATQAGALTGGSGISGNTPGQSNPTGSGFSIGTTSFNNPSSGTAPSGTTSPPPVTPTTTTPQ